MSLDLSRLENVRKRIGKIVARCPACAEQDHDQKGEHLVIFPNGSFACVANPGKEGHKHRQRIFTLASDPVLRKRGACVVWVRRPAGAKLPTTAGTVVDLSQLGTAGTPFLQLRDTRYAKTPETVVRQEYRHTRKGIRKARPNRPKSSRPQEDRHHHRNVATHSRPTLWRSSTVSPKPYPPFRTSTQKPATRSSMEPFAHFDMPHLIPNSKQVPPDSELGRSAVSWRIATGCRTGGEFGTAGTPFLQLRTREAEKPVTVVTKEHGHTRIGIGKVRPRRPKLSQ